MTDEAKARRARRTVGIGLALIFIFALLVLSPLLLGVSSISRYLVAFGLIGAMLGASFLLHGGWDWVRSR